MGARKGKKKPTDAVIATEPDRAALLAQIRADLAVANSVSKLALVIDKLLSLLR